MKRGSGPTFGLLLPLASYMLLFFVVPLLIMLVYSFWQTSGYELVRQFTLKNYVEVATSWVYAKLLWQSLVVGVSTALLCLLIAYPLSYTIAFKVKRYKDPWLFLLLL